MDGLFAKLSCGKAKEAATRELGVLGLKALTLGASHGTQHAAALVRRMGPLLCSLAAAAAGTSGSSSTSAPPAEVAQDALDVLAQLLGRFGALFAQAQQEELRCALLALVERGSPGVRKRAVACVAVLAPYLPAASLSATAGALLSSLAEPGALAELARARVAASGALLRTAAHRLDPQQLQQLLPVLANACACAPDGDAEMRELALHALECALARAPLANLAPHTLHLTTATALAALSYDPNFSGAPDQEDSQDDAMSQGGGSDADAGDDDDDGAYSDDEDVSWKVRRAAAKLLGVGCGVTGSDDEALGAFAAAAGQQLVKRLGCEREESVRLDIVAVLQALLRAASGAATAGCVSALTPSLVKAAVKALQPSSPQRTRCASFALLAELVGRCGAACVAGQLGALVGCVAQALAEKGAASSALKADALAFAHALLLCDGGCDALSAHLGSLVPPLCAAAADRYYKVSAAALRCLSAALPALAPRQQPALSAPAAALLASVCSAASCRLAAVDADVEVKEAALAALGHLLACASHAPGVDAPGAAAALLERARGDATRLAAVKALHSVASSSLPAAAAALAPLAPALAQELTGLLRKSARQLRAAALEALQALLAGAAATTLPPAAVAAAVAESSPLIADGDLALACGALALATTAVRHAPHAAAAAAAADAAVAAALPPALLLLSSPLVGGAVLASLRRFFAALGGACGTAKRGAPQSALGYDALLSQLLAAAGGVGGGKHAAAAVSVCVGGLASGADACAATAAKLLKPGGAPLGPAQLLSLGELGRRADLGSVGALLPALTAAFDGSGEEVKEAGAAALGACALGNLPHFLPIITAAVSSDGRRAYQLLQALRVVLSPPEEDGEAAGGAADHTPDPSAPPPPQGLSPEQLSAVLALLLSQAEAEEDGVRALVSDCLGCALVLHPTQLVPLLRSRYAPGAAQPPLARAVAAHAARCALMERPRAAAAALEGPPADELLGALGDADHRVRHAAAAALNAAAHYAPSLVRPRLGAALPALFLAARPVAELVRVVDLGPFKMTVDDGLELRKAVFECLDTLLDSCPGGLDPVGCVAAVLSGLGDAYDVKVSAHAALGKLCACAPLAVSQALERCCEALERTLTAKLKGDAVKQEVDRNEDLLRSALRALAALERLPDALASRPLQQLAATVATTPALAAKYALEQARGASSDGAAGGSGADAA